MQKIRQGTLLKYTYTIYWDKLIIVIYKLKFPVLGLELPP